MASKTEAPRLPWTWVWILYPLLFVIGRTLLVFLGPLRTLGRRNLPSRGGYLIVCNHVSDIDPILVFGATVHRQVRFIAKEELFDMPSIAWMMRMAGTFPIRRGSADREAIRLAVAHLQAGHVVCIFPEGQLSESGTQGPFLPGFTLIAKMAEVPIVPCGIRNSNRIMPYGSLKPRPALSFVDVSFGPPRKFEKGTASEEIVFWAEEEVRQLSAER